jgi:hypothetical protein
MGVIVMRLVPLSGLGLVLLVVLFPAILITTVSAAELKSPSPLSPRTIRQAQEALKNKGRDPADRRGPGTTHRGGSERVPEGGRAGDDRTVGC